MKIKKFILTFLVLVTHNAKPMDWKYIGTLIKHKLANGTSPEEIHYALSKILPQRSESDTTLGLDTEDEIRPEDRPTKPLSTSSSQISKP